LWDHRLGSIFRPSDFNSILNPGFYRGSGVLEGANMDTRDFHGICYQMQINSDPAVGHVPSTLLGAVLASALDPICADMAEQDCSWMETDY